MSKNMRIGIFLIVLIGLAMLLTPSAPDIKIKHDLSPENIGQDKASPLESVKKMLPDVEAHMSYEDKNRAIDIDGTKNITQKKTSKINLAVDQIDDALTSKSEGGNNSIVIDATKTADYIKHINHKYGLEDITVNIAPPSQSDNPKIQALIDKQNQLNQQIEDLR